MGGKTREPSWKDIERNEKYDEIEKLYERPKVESYHCSSKVTLHVKFLMNKKEAESHSTDRSSNVDQRQRCQCSDPSIIHPKP